MNRRERRAHQAERKRSLRRGESPVAAVPGAAERIERAAAAMASRRLPVVQETLARALSETDDKVRLGFSHAGPQAACRAGCSYCCSVYVSVTAPEAFAAVDYARSRLDEATLARVRERAARNALAVAGTSPATYPTVPCAFLEGDLCLVYEARPLSCRSMHSTEVEPCRVAFETGRDDLPVRQNSLVRTLASIEWMVFGEALSRATLDTSVYELQQAARLVLEDPSLPERWVRGEPVLLSARTDVRQVNPA